MVSDNQERRIRVASIQMGMDDGGKASNIQRAAALIDGVDGADLILLPEIWNVGYFAFDDYSAESERLSGPTVSMLCEKAAAKGVYLFGGSFVEEDGGAYYNTSVLIDRQGRDHRHLPQDPSLRVPVRGGAAADAGPDTHRGGH